MAHSPTDSSYGGLMDDLRIYNRALNETEIQELYKLGQPQEPTNLTNGLVAHYEFEDNANDSSGNGNNGTEYGGVSYVDGVIGKAGSFDGVDDWIDTNLTILPIGNEPRTISTWISLNSGTSTNIDQYVVGYGTDGYNENFGLQYGLGDTYVFGIWNMGCTYDVTIEGKDCTETIGYSNYVNQNKFYHLIALHNGDTERIYINGVLQGSKTQILNTGTSSLTIGAKNTLYFLDGIIDDLRIYNRALSDSEIQELYKLGTTTPSTPSTTTIALLNESPKDNDLDKTTFTKTWSFNTDISAFDIEIVSNSYNSVTLSDFTKDGKTLSVSLTPNTALVENKLLLKFIDANGNVVKINGSESFWSLSKINTAPRLADGQITQLVSATNEPAFIEIETYDGDGDTVTLTVEDDAGGYVQQF